MSVTAATALVKTEHLARTLSSGPKVIATLRADGKVYARDNTSAVQLANLMHYKIRTEGDIVGNKSLPTLSVPTTVLDLGKQLLKYARDNDVRGVKNMITRDAPFTSDWLGMTALHFAAMNNQFEICELLLKAGTNKDSKTKVDRTPLHLACYYGHERIVELLLTKNCQVNPRDMLRMTPLHWAVEKRHKAVARLLLKYQADVTVVSKFGKTPLALAVLTEQADLLEELQSARKSQHEQQLHAQQEKEVSAAVNSIMDGTLNEANGNVISCDMVNISDFIEEDLSNPSDPLESKTKTSSDRTVGNGDGAGLIDDNAQHVSTDFDANSTVHLLKSHGIALQQDDDESKDLLNTALRNGRQLVLSEGGKMLLSESVISSMSNISKKTLSNSNNV